MHRAPVAWYYHEVRAGREPPVPPPRVSHVVVLRRDWQTVTFPVSPVHYRFLTQVRETGDIGQALASISAWTGRPLEAVRRSWEVEVRRAWIEAGFFVERARSA